MQCVEVNMLNKVIKAGQLFRWTRIADVRSSGTAIVIAVKSDQEEGMSPETQDYAALWIEAEGRSGTSANEAFSVLLGTDGKSYLDGQEIQVQIL